MQRKFTLVFIAILAVVLLLMVGVTLSTAAASSGLNTQNNPMQGKSSATPTAAPPTPTPTQEALTPIILTNYDREYELAIAELQDLELIPLGGRIILPPTSANRFGQGGYFAALASQRPQLNFVMAGDITFTTGESDDPEDFEICVLATRLNTEPGEGANDYVAVGFDRNGEVFVNDVFDIDSDTGSTWVSEELDLDYEEPHHLLFFALDDKVTVFVDGELVLQDVIVEARKGTFGLALIGLSSFSECAGENIWIWELDSAWRGEEGVCGVSSTSQINKREGPGTNFAIAGQLPSNEVADVDGQADGQDGFVWYHLTDDSWVRSDLVDEIGPCDEAPTEE